MMPTGRDGDIDPTLSVALDAMRFTAALAVLFGHVSDSWLTGGYLWQLGGYHPAAVMVFFVLSGYVIAATTRPGATAAHYAVARLSRLYSVVLPALVLTAIFDSLGMQANPDLYLANLSKVCGSFNAADLGVRYLANGLFVQEWWVLGLPNRNPGCNAPFWSLSFEATYYVAFGLILFMRGWKRTASLAGLMLLAGPRMVLLWPIWLFGVWTWRIRPRVPRKLAWPLIAVGVALFVSFARNKAQIEQWDSLVGYGIEKRLVSHYIVGIATAALVLGISRISTTVDVRRLVQPVRRVADHTFELYLLHMPVALWAAAVSPFALGHPGQAALVYVAVAAVVIPAARLTTPLKQWMRRSVELRFA